MQLSTINNRLESHNTQPVRVEKIKLDDSEEPKANAGVGVSRTGAAALVSYSVLAPPVRAENIGVSRFHKLDFLTFDGKDDLLP